MNNSKTIQVYNAGNNTDEIQQLWDTVTNTWVNRYHSSIYYNTQNYISERVNEYWDSPNNSWRNNDRYVYTYDASGLHLVRRNHYSWFLGTNVWTNNYQITYTLDAAFRVSQSLYASWNRNTAAWDQGSRESYTYDAPGNNTSLINEQWNAITNTYINNFKQVSVYNSFNQILSETQMEWISGAWTVIAGDSRTNYYYESYTTGIPILKSATVIMSVAPVPAQGDVHLSLEWDTPQSFSAVVTDMQGHVYTTFSAPAEKKFTTVLSLSALPAGNYMLSVYGAHGDKAIRTISLLR